MSKPIIAANFPFAIEVESGKIYHWCQCGRSSKQPFCDGSHRDTDFEPVKYQAEENKTLYFCGCKYTNNPPLCDGSHKQLS